MQKSRGLVERMSRDHFLCTVAHWAHPTKELHACIESLHSCLTLRHPMDFSPPGSSVLGILQARILEWVAMAFTRGSSWPRGWTCISKSVALTGGFFSTEPTWKAPPLCIHVLNLLSQSCFPCSQSPNSSAWFSRPSTCGPRVSTWATPKGELGCTW